MIAQERLGPGRIHHCMRWLGIADRAFDMMCDARQRAGDHADGETLADRQVIQHWVAELDAEIRGRPAADAARRVDDRPRGRQRPPATRSRRSSSSVANTMLHAVDRAIQVHGALGVTDDTVLAYWYRHERAARIYDGADEVHKTTLGRRILRRHHEEGMTPQT